ARDPARLRRDRPPGAGRALRCPAAPAPPRAAPDRAGGGLGLQDDLRAREPPDRPRASLSPALLAARHAGGLRRRRAGGGPLSPMTGRLGAPGARICRNRPARGPTYGGCVGLTGVAIVASLLLSLPIGSNASRLLLAAVMVSAWYGGLGPGLVATALGATTGTLVSLPSEYGGSSTPATLVPLSAFLLEAAVICVLATVLRAAQHRAEALAVSEQAARSQVEATAQRPRDVR